MALCSIVITAYNVEQYIAQAIESALAQSFQDREVIVVNDGSTDHTVREIEPYLGQIRFLTQQNKGLAGARNAAIAKSTGSYIALLDGDDVFLEDRLSKLIEFLEHAPDFGFATSDAFLLMDSHPTSRRYYESLPPRQRFRSKKQPYWIVQTDFIFGMTVIRKTLFEQYGLFDESLRSCEDWNMWTRFILGGERVGLIDEPLAYYRIRLGSLSADRRAAAEEELIAMERAIESSRSHDLPGVSGRLEFMHGKRDLLDHQMSSARAHFRRALFGRSLDASTRLKALYAYMAPSYARNRYSRLIDSRASNRHD